MGARQRLRSMGVWVRDRGLVLQGVWRELVACRCPCRGWVIYGGVPVSARPGQRGAEKKGIDEEFVVNQIRSPWRHGQCYTWLEEWRTVAEEDESWMTRRRPCCERRERCDDGRSISHAFLFPLLRWHWANFHFTNTSPWAFWISWHWQLCTIFLGQDIILTIFIWYY